MALTLTDFPSFCRFVGIAKKRAYDVDPLDGRLRHTFRLMDREKAGGLSAADLRRYLITIGLTLTEEQSERITELVCKDDNSTFDEDDLVSFIKTQVALSS